jgi:hypothetical protein
MGNAQSEDEIKNHLLKPFGFRIWFVDGPAVNFRSISYPTRMVVVRLRGKRSWIWSPVALTEELAEEVEATAGPVTCIVSPNRRHRRFLKEWQQRFPDAKVFASPGLQHQTAVTDVVFHAVLTSNITPIEYSIDLEQLVFVDEVCFFHKPSKTLIICDLIQSFPETTATGLQGILLKLNCLVGSQGATPAELRLMYWLGGHLPDARKQLNIILAEWRPQRMILAHGDCTSECASVIVANAFRWIPENPRACICGCIPATKTVDGNYDESEDC